MGDFVNVYIGAPDGQTAVSLSSADKIHVSIAAGFTGSGGGGGGGATNITITRTATAVTVNSDTGTDGTISAADGTNAGVMTAAMQLKLAGIESGAEVNDSAAEILAKVITVDGTGSGLDADLLDGNHASAFAAAVHTHAIGDVTGLQTALDSKVDENAAITGATKTKITYDSKGLVTAGADATTADIADSTDKRYVTEAEKTKLANTSGTNTGDQNLFSTIAVSGQSNVVADGTGDTLTLVAGSNITITTDASTDSITISSSGGGGGGSTAWGAITGTLSNQTDLQTALDGKVDENAAITGATKTKITYDAKGLVTAGADAGIADITGLQTALDGKITAFADPNADRIVFWDDSAGAFTALTASTGLTISGTNMTVRTASESQTGIVELATSAETTTGTSTTLAVHPAGLAAQNFLKADTTATLTNKTIDANGTGNSIINIEVADFAGSAIVTAAETISANNNDTTIPTSAAVKAYADSVAGGGISDGDKGDITVSSSGTVWTVDNDAVTYAKIQNVSAASRLLGRGSAGGSGDVEEITIGSGLSLSGTTLSASGGGGGGDVTVLNQTTTQTGPVNTTTETAIFSHTLPTDLAAGETLVLDITGEVLNNSGAGQTVDIYVKLGTTTAVFYSTTQGTSATKRNFHMRVIVFIVSTTSQKFSVVSQMAPGNTGTGGVITTSFAVGTFAGYGTAAENTTSAKTLQVTADLGAANANFYWYAEAATLTRIAAP
jgi:hypothetical protein